MSTGSHVIIGKVLLSATLHLESPLLMGKGNGEWVDKELMRLPDGSPYIPSSAFAGSLRSLMESEQLLREGEEWLWGSPMGEKGTRQDGNKSQSYQSHLIVHDLKPSRGSDSPTVVKRDGIRISHKTNTVEDGKKYDYEIVEQGADFSFMAELTIRSGFGAGKDGEMEDISIRLMEAIHHVRFRLGAFTSQGFGKLRVDKPSVRYFAFPTDHSAWFTFLESGSVPTNVKELKPVSGWKATGHYPFSVVGRFRIKSAMMVGAPGHSHAAADKSAIKSKDRFVLPGKSIRGALRHRAERILKIMQPGAGMHGNDNLTNDLFGYVSEGKGGEAASVKGRILIEESLIENGSVKPMLQNRIRIDRFTGGVIDGGLFNSEPIWTTDQESIEIAIHIHRDPKPIDKKLLLMLLKDLWTGDLPIGGEKNIGRGILVGLEARVYESGSLLSHFLRKGEDRDEEEVDVKLGAQELENIMQTH
jgi:CRISPR/Cas system CSM-associated protein Csm3 (group 7 of RAMP superfamily)